MPLESDSPSSWSAHDELESQCRQAPVAVFSTELSLQQLCVAFALQQLSRRAAATTNAGGFTPCFLAQASFCASVWQQHPRQHVSASVQPQGQFSQGNRSPAVVTVHAGSGTPTEQIATVAHASQAAILCFRGTRASDRAGSDAWQQRNPLAGVNPPI
jgi:hypothetical protein